MLDFMIDENTHEVLIETNTYVFVKNIDGSIMVIRRDVPVPPVTVLKEEDAVAIWELLTEIMEWRIDHTIRMQTKP